MSNMRDVNCDNCSATYKINLDKIKKEKSRITCRRCQNKIVIYKSKLLEPQNEQAVVNHDDEKTLVEESLSAPNPMQGYSEDPQTAISDTQPPSKDSVSNSGMAELSDPTIRKMSPPPVISSPRSAVNTSPYASINEELKPEANVSGADPAGVKGTFRMLAGLMAVTLVALIALPLVSNLAISSGFAALGVGSTVVGLMLVFTGDFGFVKPNTSLSFGLGVLAAGVVGAVSFAVTPAVEVSETEPKSAPELTPPPVKVAQSKGLTTDETKTTASSVPVQKTQSDSSTSGTRNLLKDELSKVTQKTAPLKNKPVDNTDLDDVEEVADRPNTEPSDAVDPDEGFDDELNIEGFDDLGLDEEPEEKKGLFGRNKERSSEPELAKPEPKAEAKPSSSSIPTSVLDIIIRNNKDVKSCYIQQRKETGSMPSSVKIMFTLQPVSGGTKTTSVSSAYISNGPYVGSKFEGCLRSAFKKMSFPSDNTTPQTLSYTLKL